MYLGQVNIFRKKLSRIKEIISQKYRREILSTEFSNEIYKLSKNGKKKNINIMDYGSGYNPIHIDKIVKKILIKNKEIKIKVYCFDHYSKEQIKKLNKSAKFIFRNIIDNKKYYKWYWPIINSKKLQFISVLK